MAAWGLSPAAHAQIKSGDGRTAFEIPAQALSKALIAFSAATGIEVLVDARYTEGRTSNGAVGVMAPREALGAILTGTPLTVEILTPGTVALKAIAPEQGPPARSPYGTEDEPPYFASIQRAVLLALCRRQETAPGHYRLALALWIDPSGKVARWRRLDTTGNQKWDGALDAALASLDIGERPPQGLPQPVVLVILPRPARDSGRCSERVLPASDRSMHEDGPMKAGREP